MRNICAPQKLNLGVIRTNFCVRFFGKRDGFATGKPLRLNSLLIP